MKKSFKPYALLWFIMFVAWFTVVFLVEPVIPGYIITYDARFWISFLSICVAFIGNLLCAYISFKAENIKKLFLNLSLITISWSELFCLFVIGSVLMLIPNCPAWIAAIVCIIVIAFDAIAIIKAGWAVGAVRKVDERINIQISFIKNLTVDMENNLSRAKSDTVKAACKKIYEAVRYSDPISNETLSAIEKKIAIKAEEFSNVVNVDDVDKANEVADQIIILISERNKKCKVIK